MRDAVESTEPMGIERDRWASREAEVSGSERVNHFVVGLDTIRDPRIACRDGFRDAPSSCSASEVRSRGVSTEIASLA